LLSSTSKFLVVSLNQPITHFIAQQQGRIKNQNTEYQDNAKGNVKQTFCFDMVFQGTGY